MGDPGMALEIFSRPAIANLQASLLMVSRAVE
jgi:hypothetical protein